ncbi:hypothetical protein BC938DRAFT_481658 [Jimgerdemannia flammicorona]|uniref:Major facilitator superfamily (MFS) profile domain-containing protein n=1 Tax=Jimgerdemannia flammicorona TaxID=994334 RepID=A0A433QFR6_9FUNG|nr:hypothetical protein BC938DRAFT_481658 [Jimgerdemannia flammicorona]
MRLLSLFKKKQDYALVSEQAVDKERELVRRLDRRLLVFAMLGYFLKVLDSTNLLRTSVGWRKRSRTLSTIGWESSSHLHANPQQCNSLPCAPLKIPPLPRTRLVHLDFRYGSRAKCERCVYNPIFARSSRGRVLSGDCVPHRVVVHKNRAWQAVLTVRHGWIAGRLCQRRDASRAAQDDERNVGVERVGFWGAWGKCLERSYRSRGVVINYITKFGRGGCNRFVTDYTHVHGRPGAVAVIQLTPKRRYSIKPTFLLKMALALRFRWHHHYCSRRRRLLPPPRLPCQHDLALRRGTRPSYRSSRARRQEHTSCGFLVAAPASHVWDVAPVRVCVHMGVPARVVGGDMATWACGEEAWPNTFFNMICILTNGYISDHLHNRMWCLVIPALFAIAGYIILAIFVQPFGALYVGFLFVTLGAGSESPVVMTWVNEILSDNMEARGLTIAAMNCMSGVMASWLPLVMWPMRRIFVGHRCHLSYNSEHQTRISTSGDCDSVPLRSHLPYLVIHRLGFPHCPLLCRRLHSLRPNNQPPAPPGPAAEIVAARCRHNGGCSRIG